jgi:hypothetical protein
MKALCPGTASDWDYQPGCDLRAPQPPTSLSQQAWERWSRSLHCTAVTFTRQGFPMLPDCVHLESEGHQFHLFKQWKQVFPELLHSPRGPEVEPMSTTPPQRSSAFPLFLPRSAPPLAQSQWSAPDKGAPIIPQPALPGWQSELDRDTHLLLNTVRL